MQNLASFLTSLNFEPPTFENAARRPNTETEVQCSADRPTSLPSRRAPPPKIAWQKRAKSSITQ